MQKLCFIGMIFLLFCGCKRQNSTQEKNDKNTNVKLVSIAPSKVTQYSYPDWVLTYAKIENLGKKVQDMKVGHGLILFHFFYPFQ